MIAHHLRHKKVFIDIKEIIKYYFNNDKTAICDTNIDDGILALKLIEDMREQIKV